MLRSLATVLLALTFLATSSLAVCPAAHCALRVLPEHSCCHGNPDEAPSAAQLEAPACCSGKVFALKHLPSETAPAPVLAPTVAVSPLPAPAYLSWLQAGTVPRHDTPHRPPILLRKQSLLL